METLKHIFYVPMFIGIMAILLFIVVLVYIFDNKLFVKHELNDFFKVEDIKQQYKYFITT